MEHFGQELFWCAHRHAAGVNDMAENPVNGSHEHFHHFVERNGVLVLFQVGVSQEEENGLDACSHRLLDAGSIPYFGVKVIIDISVMGCVMVRAVVSVDAMIEAVRYRFCERKLCGLAQAAVEVQLL